MPIHYITTDGEPPNGGRTPGHRGPAPPRPTQQPPPAPAGYIPHPPMAVRCYHAAPPAAPPVPMICHPIQPAPATYSGKCCKPVPPPARTPAPAQPVPLICHPVAPAPACSGKCCKPVPPPLPVPTPAPAQTCCANHPPRPASPNMKTLCKPALAVIHLLDKGFKPWEKQGMVFQWEPHKVPTNVKIQELIEVIRPKGDCCRAEGIVEIIEAGNGKWVKGTQFRLGERRSGQTLGEVGWGAGRGTERKPVWIAWG
ncbi:MAG: hypothetical protein MMC23_009797 [Stictis urceolatum]|nr:hypothetical protein [Stictis urceolata]